MIPVLNLRLKSHLETTASASSTSAKIHKWPALLYMRQWIRRRILEMHLIKSQCERKYSLVYSDLMKQVDAINSRTDSRSPGFSWLLVLQSIFISDIAFKPKYVSQYLKNTVLNAVRKPFKIVKLWKIICLVENLPQTTT